MNVLAIIPARGGSKGVKKKNIRLLKGKPLIAWTIEAALKSNYINNVIVSTDCKEIAGVGRVYGSKIIMRPDSLSTDEASTVDVIYHVLECLGKENKPDLIVLLQCTSPFRSREIIDKAIEIYINNREKYESLISVCEEQKPVQWMIKVENEKITPFFDYDKNKLTRRQDFNKLYRYNGAIYISSPENFEKNNGFLSSSTMAYIMDFKSSIDIDTEMDFSFAEFLIEKELDS